MAFSELTQVRIQAALRAKAIGSCPLGHTAGWILGDGFVTLSLSDSLANIVIGGTGLPCIPLICRHCGYTALINIIVLGLGDLLPQQGNAESPSP